jgi:hypothetical protein
VQLHQGTQGTQKVERLEKVRFAISRSALGVCENSTVLCSTNGTIKENKTTSTDSIVFQTFGVWLFQAIRDHNISRGLSAIITLGSPAFARVLPMYLTTLFNARSFFALVQSVANTHSRTRPHLSLLYPTSCSHLRDCQVWVRVRKLTFQPKLGKLTFHVPPTPVLSPLTQSSSMHASAFARRVLPVYDLSPLSLNSFSAANTHSRTRPHLSLLYPTFVALTCVTARCGAMTCISNNTLTRLVSVYSYHEQAELMDWQCSADRF